MNFCLIFRHFLVLFITKICQLTPTFLFIILLHIGYRAIFGNFVKSLLYFYSFWKKRGANVKWMKNIERNISCQIFNCLYLKNKHTDPSFSLLFKFLYSIYNTEKSFIKIDILKQSSEHPLSNHILFLSVPKTLWSIGRDWL